MAHTGCLLACKHRCSAVSCVYHIKLTHQQVIDQDLTLTFNVHDMMSTTAVFLPLCQEAILRQAAIRAHNKLCTTHGIEDTRTCTEPVMHYGPRLAHAILGHASGHWRPASAGQGGDMAGLVKQ